MAWDRERNALALLDEEFLVALQEEKERVIYARIASLDINGLPIEYIEGKVTGGSINIDGASSVRRTCNLTMITDQVDINDVYWGVKTKFKLEIGLTNDINDNYPEIIWFPQGEFLIASFNTSISTNSCSISLSGKDKMCALNGDLSGQLFASIDFGQEEIQNLIFNEAKYDFNTSDQFMTRTVYLKLAEGGPEGPVPGTGEPFTWTPQGSEEAIEGKVYQFMVDEASENPYYRQGSYYYRLTNANYTGKKYSIYQQVDDPEELFEEVNSEEYVAGKFYINESGYYKIDRSTAARSDITYYKVKPLYELSYEYTIKKLPIERIIRESVHTYAQEPYHNIIINDLDKYGLEQLTYRGDKRLFALRNKSTQHFMQLTQEGSSVSLDAIVQDDNFVEDSLTSENTNDRSTEIYYDENNREYRIVPSSSSVDDSKRYTIAIFENGDDCGYRITDLVYAGDLVSGLGDTLTSILDKIKTMLGDFEYFYDIQGRFVFQRKKTYVQTSFSQLTDNGDETYVTYGNDKKKFSFSFEGNRLISAIQNSPVLNNLKNDYSVWGKRISMTGAELPIHVRYAIDKKPKEYMSLRGCLYITEEGMADPSTTYIDKIKEDQEYQLNNFKQNVNIIPDFLKTSISSSSCDWWELRDWAKYYKLLTGAYPSQRLLEYGNEGYIGTITFPDGTTRTFTGKGQLIIDLNLNNNYNPLYSKRNSYGASVSWRPFQHGFDGCQHTYAEYLNFYSEEPNMISFIYKPQIPNRQVIEQDQGQSQSTSVNEALVKLVDWRELIYQMATDYFQGQGCSALEPIIDINGEVVLTDPDHFLSKVGELNPYYYPTGYTGYEQYYTDMEGFWRQLYNPDYIPELVYTAGRYEITDTYLDSTSTIIRKKKWHPKTIDDVNFKYYVNGEKELISKQYEKLPEELQKKYRKYCYIAGEGNAEILKRRRYWNVDVFNNPEVLNFWIEFLDDEYELAQFAVPAVGQRSKTINDDKISAIFFREIPDLILSDALNSETQDLAIPQLRGEILDQSGYQFIYIPKGFAQYFVMSYRNLSAKNKVDELLYQFAYCVENISITALPIYHLEPNTRIYVRDENTHINGEYIVSRLTIPLAYNGTMSISATKAPERLY